MAGISVEDKQGTSLNDVIEQEASTLSDLHRRVIVSAMIKFEKQLVVAAKLSMQAKIRDVASWDEHALWKNCRDTFESLKDQLLGRNKEYVEKFRYIVEVLAVKWTKKTRVHIHHKFLIKRMLNLLKKAAVDVENMLEQGKFFLCLEFASAQVVVLRLGVAQERVQVSEQDVNSMVKECQ